MRNALSTRDLAKAIRKDVLRMVHSAKASHVASCLSITDIIAVLYGAVMRHDAANPSLAARDRYILSKGHAAAAVYATLANLGFIPRSDLEQYGKNGSVYMTHVSNKIPGVEFSSGSLGHGLPFGTGKALAARRRGLDWRVFVQLSDGEMDEGSNWEAILFAAHHKLDNLVAIIDYNKLQSLASVSDTLGLEPLAAKLAAFGWSVREMDGHDHTLLEDSLSSTPWEAGKPSVLIANTVKGKGVGFMENRVEWHYKSPNDEQLRLALSEIDANHA
jgi:transketolase